MFALLRSLFGSDAKRSAGVEYAHGLSWRQFEFVVREGFRRRGYGSATPVEGVDVVLSKDGEKYFVQCKQWKASKLGEKSVQELMDRMSGSDAAGGFIITCGVFTEEARALARQTTIELLDEAGMEQLVIDARRPEPFLDPTEGRRQTSFRKADSEPSCPLCGGAMVKRTTMHGPNKGRTFWGCLQSPQCRGTRDT